METIKTFCSFTVILLMFGLKTSAKDFTIEDISQIHHDLSAAVHSRNDYNDSPCALVKVQCTLENLVFEGNIVGDIENKAGEYWVYLTNGTKFLKIKHPRKTPIEINFTEFGIPFLKSKSTYCIKIHLEKEEAISDEIIPYNDPCVEMGHKWVDLGLSVYWAQCNIGAKTPIEPGLYFAWGEKYEKQEFSEFNSETMNRVFSEISGLPENDAARNKWKGNWRIPTYSEFQELKTKCQWRWKSKNGMNGFEVIGPNGNSIFLPCAGIMVDNDLKDFKETGDYWTSTPQPNRNSYSFLFDIDKNEKSILPVERYLGASIRPILSK